MFNALILAGQRSSADPVARMHNQTHKALVPIENKAMLRHVGETIQKLHGLQNLYVMSERADLLEQASLVNGQLLDTGPSPAASLAKALGIIGLRIPLLVTTADHPLLTKEMIDHLLHNTPQDCDLAVALAPADLVLKSYPGAIRTYYRFRDKAVSGCNLFLVRQPDARKIVEFWLQMEKARKKPWRIALKIGLPVLLRYALGLLSLEQAFTHVSKLTGTKIAPILMPYAEAAIDVDKPEDLLLVQRILKSRH